MSDTPDDTSEPLDILPEVRYVGVPDGPKRFVPEFGLEVDTFTQEPGDGKASLRWHVPLNMRGPFRPEQLANYDPETKYRTNLSGWVVCKKKVVDDKGERYCRRKAMHRTPRCEMHGGRLHPLDKLLVETGEEETEKPMSRYQLFLAKQLTVEDLDDDEILGFGFKTDKGTIFKPKNIPRDMVLAFTRATFDRALDKLKYSALDAAKTLSSLMLDETVEPNVRRQCAESILDRTLGKAPMQVTLRTNAPWETVFEAIAAQPVIEAIDAEVIPEPPTADEGVGSSEDIEAQ